MKILSTIIVLGVAAGSHALLVIDNFADSQGPYTTSTTGWVGGRELTGNAEGGSRAIVSAQTNLFGGVHSTRVGNGLFGDNAFGMTSRTVVAYYSTALNVANAMFNFSGLTNQDFSGYTEFNVDLLGNDAPLTTTLTLFSFDAGLTSVRTYSRTFAVGGARREVLSAADITGTDVAFDASAVDFMWFVFDAPASGDFGVRGLSAVPEPGTLLVLALGGLALAHRRKK